MIDPSKVKVGDTLVAHLKVTHVVGPDFGVALAPWDDDGLPICSISGATKYFNIARFAEHIPAPRKIEVGSRVEIQLSDRRLGGVVHAIVGDNAAVEWFGSSNYLGLPLVEMLEVID